MRAGRPCNHAHTGDAACRSRQEIAERVQLDAKTMMSRPFVLDGVCLGDGEQPLLDVRVSGNEVHSVDTEEVHEPRRIHDDDGRRHRAHEWESLSACCIGETEENVALDAQGLAQLENSPPGDSSRR